MLIILTFTSSLLDRRASWTQERPAPSSGIFLHGPDLALHLHRVVQKRPLPLQGHLCALWHMELH